MSLIQKGEVTAETVNVLPADSELLSSLKVFYSSVDISSETLT